MSARSVEDLRAEIARLAEGFDPVWERTLAATLNGGASEELREECRERGREVRAAIDRLEITTSDIGVLREFDGLGKRADQAILTKGDAAQEMARAQMPTRYDPESGERLDALGVLNLATKEIGGNVEWLGVRQIGLQDARWYSTIRSQATGEPAELRSFTTAQLFEGSLSKLSARVREVRGGRLPTPRKGSDGWVKFTDALTEAAEIEEHHVTEQSVWRRRLARYLADRLGPVCDPEVKEGREHILEELGGEPFEDTEGRLCVNVGTLGEFFEPRHLDSTDQEIAAALADLGFVRFTVQERTAEGRNRKRTYWRAPAGFDWRQEA